MAGIQLSGLVSGLDTQSIISQLMAVERQPRTAITNQQSIAQKRQSLLQSVATKVTTLKNSVDDLASISTWLNTQSVTSTDDTKLSASYTGGAPPGGYDVAITQLATADRQTYNYTPPAADGPLEIHNQDGSLRASVQLKAGATIDDAVSAINSNSDANVFAVNVNGQLVMAAKTTGVSSAFTTVGAGTLANEVAGQDAQFSIGTTNYTRSSNVVTDALPGVTLTLKSKTAAGSSVGLTIGGPAPNADTVVTKVKTFITAYNDLVGTVRDDLSDKVVPNPQSLSDVTAGSLFGDTGLGDMRSSLRSSVASSLPGLTGLTSLADIGISTGAANTGTSINQDSVDGKLTLDETKLRDALSSNMLGVQKVLGGAAGVTGFAQSFATVLNPYQGTGGILDQRITSTTSDLSRIADKLTEFDARMDSKEAYYQKQFTALETALQQSQSMGNSLAGLIGSSSSG